VGYPFERILLLLLFHVWVVIAIRLILTGLLQDRLKHGDRKGRHARMLNALISDLATALLTSKCKLTLT